MGKGRRCLGIEWEVKIAARTGGGKGASHERIAVMVKCASRGWSNMHGRTEQNTYDSIESTAFTFVFVYDRVFGSRLHCDKNISGQPSHDFCPERSRNL